MLKHLFGVYSALPALTSLICAAQANDEKMRLEEKQRQERAATQAAGKPWTANWFEQVRCPNP